jgi:LmbE family N-acetylglucosaminyl deacetylase
MTHVLVAPHPDHVAPSCGGLIASLREIGQNVTIVTVVSGNGAAAGLTTYRREALGFGTKVASLGGLPGFAERHWASSRL